MTDVSEAAPVVDSQLTVVHRAGRMLPQHRVIVADGTARLTNRYTTRPVAVMSAAVAEASDDGASWTVTGTNEATGDTEAWNFPAVRTKGGCRPCGHG